jgi:hypothetical protein
MRKVITMVLYNRPDYTAEVLAALNRCAGIEDYLISFHVDPGNEEVIERVRQVDFAEFQLMVNPERFGGGRNTYRAWETGFGLSDFIVHLEDDTIPAPDCLRFMEFCAQEYKDNRKIFSVASYNRYPCPKDQWHAISTRAGFNCWLIGLWKDRWPWAKKDWNPSPKVYATHLSRRVFKSGLHEVYPLLSRSQNIGERDGIHEYTPTWHRIYHRTDHWAETLEAAPARYVEVKNPKVTALLIADDDALNIDLAIDCFKHQTYVHKELLIINCGPRPLDRRDDARVRELMVSPAPPEDRGRLYESGAREAHADLIMMWGDHWRAAEQMEVQVSALNQANAVLLKHRLEYDYASGHCYRCCDEEGAWSTLLFSPSAINLENHKVFSDRASFREAVKEVAVIDNDPSLYVRFFDGSTAKSETSRAHAIAVPAADEIRNIAERYFERSAPGRWSGAECGRELGTTG